MSFVRIDLLKGKDSTYRQEIGRTAYDALVNVGVPSNDPFEVIQEHEADGLLFDANYLGIHGTKELVLIQITWNEGRNMDQKRVLYNAIADGLTSRLGLRQRLHQPHRGEEGNWSFGNGEVQYAA